jgi:peroxiredoxin
MHWISLRWGCRERLVPDFRLKTSGGEEVVRSQFRQRSHLVLLFLPEPAAPEAQQLMADLVALAPKFRENDAVIYALSANPAHGALPIPVLHDPEDVVRGRFASLLEQELPEAGEPFLVILDRFGSLSDAARGPLGQAELAKETLSWVQGIQHECPE